MSIPVLDRVEDQLVAALYRQQAAENAIRHRRPTVRIAAAGLATAGLAGVMVVGVPGSEPSSSIPFTAQPALAEVMVDRDGERVTLTFGELWADPRNVAAALAEAGVTGKVTFVPSSPSLVGRLVALGESRAAAGQISMEYDDGDAVSNDIVSLSFPASLTDDIQVVIGRRAVDGELYTSSAADATAPDEALHCVTVYGSVRDVLPALQASGVKLHWVNSSYEPTSPGEVMDEYVIDAIPMAANEVKIATHAEPPEQFPDTSC